MIDYCTNPSCREPLGVDHVQLVTTGHVRRFCSVECIEPSRQAFERARAEAYQSSQSGPDVMIRRMGFTMENRRP